MTIIEVINQLIEASNEGDTRIESPITLFWNQGYRAGLESAKNIIESGALS